MRRMRLAVVACVILIGALFPPFVFRSIAIAQQAAGFRLELVANGLGRITAITHAGDGSGRLFVADKSGYVWIVKNGKAFTVPFLDIQSPVRARENEQGLLGLAFHPDFEANGRFFVHYTDNDGAVTIASYRVSQSNPDQADPKSGLVLMVIPKKGGDHNGGMLQFGPEGYLYVAVGDGGAESEPERNAQRIDVLLGKILRIDVDKEENGKPYAIPPDNPFAGINGAMPEIWAYGLRNPWRFSFDRENGDVYIADVGLWQAEEVNVQRAGSSAGRNYGWNIMEGEFCHDAERAAECGSAELTPPVFVYYHDQGCAIVGGYVYRGEATPALSGRYVFGDYCLGNIWTLQEQDGDWQATGPVETGLNISTFGEDESGELFVGDLEGTLFQLLPE
jgi:glucose/arabinose dehydrogenase